MAWLSWFETHLWISELRQVILRGTIKRWPLKVFRCMWKVKVLRFYNCWDISWGFRPFFVHRIFDLETRTCTLLVGEQRSLVIRRGEHCSKQGRLCKSLDLKEWKGRVIVNGCVQLTQRGELPRKSQGKRNTNVWVRHLVKPLIR